MKRITLLLGLILSFGYVSAQLGTLPELSTDDSGPWYLIKGKGDDGTGPRTGTIFIAQNDPNPDWTPEGGYVPYWDPQTTLRIFNASMNLAEQSLDDVLFRFEQVADEDGVIHYDIISKRGLKVDQLQIQSYPTNNTSGEISTYTDRAFLYLTTADETSTSWKITPRTGYPNFFHILATEPLNADMPSMHMGNWGFWSAITFEGTQWGYGENSSFFFQKYEAGFSIDKVEVDFGSVSEDWDPDGVDNQKTFKAETLFDITGDYTVEYDANDGFIVVAETETETGVTYVVYFTPGNGPGDYSTTVTVKNETSGGPVEQTIDLKGQVLAYIPLKTSPTIEASADDVWYNFLFDKRTGYYMTDKGADEKIEALPGFDKNESSQLWKVVPVEDSNTDVVIVSKFGNLLSYEVESITGDDDVVTEVGRFYTSAASEATFSFTLNSNSTGGYYIKWNEYVDVEVDDVSAYINKTRTDLGFTEYANDNDPGSSVVFIEQGSDEYVKTLFPQFSNGDGDDMFYYLRFSRVAAATPEKAIVNDGVNNVIAQVDVIEDEPYYLWKLEGTWDNFKIVSVADENEFGEAMEGSIMMASAGAGASYRFASYTPSTDGYWSTWQVECINDLSVSSRFVNDFEGGGLIVGGYTGFDGGNEIYFTPMSQWEWPVGIEEPTEVEGDSLVTTQYYTIQGTLLGGKPSVQGIYIEKKIYESKKVETRKILVQGK